MSDKLQRAGIYIHFPFCLSRCSYCDFVTEIYRDEDFVEKYIAAICKEISLSAASPYQVDTIYFGGGTPSLLKSSQLERILKIIDLKFSLMFDELEITLEMNPASISLEKLKQFKSLGINRASFGVQTFDDYLLRILSRRHTAKQSIETFHLLRKAGFDNVSFDLIVGLPHQTMQIWKDDLKKAIDLNPEHLSLYLLEIHEGTPLAKQIRSQRQPQPDEDLSAEMYKTMIECLENSGYVQYEISNFARSGFQSRHNLKYWRCSPVFGFGVSAFSFCDGRRWSNEKNIKKYIETVESGRLPINFTENVNLASEFAFLGLRLADGINLDEYKQRFGFDLLEQFHDEIEKFQKLGLVEIKEGSLRLTKQGMIYSNEVFMIFV
ncbi:MAG: radical SAM family heme chaperone HemW [Pyrinomonadaceae bacterium]|nr:radical SAM family heme chaperone HemW [Pyrinomonadaceae bacterium]MCX7639203.1 radical SAM family heme chaperone HemW [Pyrinomonadaceae bacterium]MDW8303575.1 radical SAM family heme chaperone HemW [Acidobacteriota bacterium]